MVEKGIGEDVLASKPHWMEYPFSDVNAGDSECGSIACNKKEDLKAAESASDLFDITKQGPSYLHHLEKYHGCYSVNASSNLSV